VKNIAALFFLVLTGCAVVQLTPEARRVRVITPSVATATGCQFLGMQSARGVAIEGGMRAAQVKIRNQVAAASGNAMVVTGSDLEQMGSSTHGNVTVDAYRCP
jgi:hypothetical protein